MARDEQAPRRRGIRASIARRTFLGFRADVIGAVSAIAVAIIVARGLGPADRGLFFLVYLAATMIALFADLGLSTTAIVFGANREIPARRLHGTALAFCLAATAFAAALLLPFQDFWSDGVLNGLDTTLMVMLVAGVFPVLYAQVLVALLTGMGHVPEVSLVRIGQAVVYPALVTAPALAGDPHWSVAAWLAAAALYAAGLAWYAIQFAGRPELPPRDTLRQVLSFGGRSYVGTLSQQGFLRVDVLFLSARSGPTVVGIYSLATIFAERIGLIGHAMYGASAEAVGKGGQAAAELTALTVKLMMTLLVPIAIVLALLAQPGFPLVFGDEFEDAALPFTLLLPGTIAICCWAFVTLYIVSALRRPGTATLLQGTALLISLPLYYFAVRAEGMTGAALVSSGVYIALFSAGIAVLLRTSDVRLRDVLPGPKDLPRILALVRASLNRES